MIEITEKEFRQFAEHIEHNYGIHLKDEKKSLLCGRLSSVLEKNNFTNFSDYFSYLLSDSTGDAARTLIDRITTNYTYFMRESSHFVYFKNTILPNLERTVRDNDLRVWSAGCSSGEEAYTLAFIMDEYLRDKKYWDTKILATDISENALNTAKAGIYETGQIEALPASWRVNYFAKTDGNHWVVQKEIRNQVIFRYFNLKDNAYSFKKKFHVIFCRNVMIYFNNETKHELVSRFYDATESGGYLFIGHAESLNREQTKYKFIMPAVYRKE
jgi:chemotaxis protein methyltransferase CheR